MEHIDSAYAEYLHGNGVHPYSQYISEKNGKIIWTVNALNDEAYEKIIVPLMREHQFQLKNGINVMVQGSRLEQISEESLLEQFYQERPEKYLNIDFLMPTAFKQNGRYVIYPDFSLIYGSLLRKYSSLMEMSSETDTDTLEQLISGSELANYRLRTEKFPLEGISITGYRGTVGIRIHGTDTMAAYIRMLFRFGTYAGIGIKTSLGMGAIEIRRTERK